MASKTVARFWIASRTVVGGGMWGEEEGRGGVHANGVISDYLLPKLKHRHKHNNMNF